MEITQIKLKLYLKHRLPITVILSDEAHVDTLVNELNGIDNVIKFGEIVFLKDDFRFMTIKEEK